MVRVRPFAALRPPKELVQQVSAAPYDVMNSEEAARLATPKSLLHITRPEIDFNPIAGETEDRVYRQGLDNFCTWQERGYLKRDPKPCYYIYGQTFDAHSQFGIVLCAHTDDYMSGAIKKHELTRKDKEDGRMKHILMQQANLEPVFFCYPDNAVLAAMIEKVVAEKEPEYDFSTYDGRCGHRLWIVDSEQDQALITSTFADIPAMYIADGHHRSAAAARVGGCLAAKNPAHTGDEEYNFFMAVCFPQSQLLVMDYNRVVRDLNGMDSASFLKALESVFRVEKREGLFRPSALHQFSMYLDGSWYSLDLKEGLDSFSDPVECLDSALMSRYVLGPILGIEDLRTDERIDFIGGIRGLEEISSRVDSGEMAVGFALYPVSMDQIVAVADSGGIMPPKTTWFEPKLRSGLTVHTFYEE